MNHTLAFIGGNELWIVLIVILVLFGGKKIPELMRGVGRGMGELQKGMEEGKKTINTAIEDGKKDVDNKKDFEDDDKKS